MPSQYQVPTADIVSGFSISAWVRPDVGIDGFILSKFSSDGVTVHYGLKVTITGIQYRYSGNLYVSINVKHLQGSEVRIGNDILGDFDQ